MILPSEMRNDNAPASRRCPSSYYVHEESHGTPSSVDHNMLDRLSSLQSPRPRNKQVKFSESSMLYRYPEDEDPSYSKSDASYTTSERKASTQNAIREAIRIKALLSRPNVKSNESSLNSHLELCGVSKEEILGIEHFALEDPMRALERRRNHVKVVLMEQENLKMMMLSSPGGDKNDVDCADKLAQLSWILAKKPKSRARSRAAMAA